MKLRAVLRCYYPAALTTFEDLNDCDARAALRLAPSPDAATRLRRSPLRAGMIRNGRQRNLDTQADRIITGLRAPGLRQAALVEQAMARQTLGYVTTLDAIATPIAELETAMA